MFQEVLKQIKIGIILLFLFTILTGLLYPAVITGVAQLLFPWQANGSLVEQNGKTIGSDFIGQGFSDANYFWSRPSATIPFSYNAANSSGSNLGPSNRTFLDEVKHRVENLQQSDPRHNPLIPVDLVTASGSGLDPDISPSAAYYQVPRIAKARHISELALQTLIKKFIKCRTFGILGEPRVNVLQLNLALDSLKEQ